MDFEFGDIVRDTKSNVETVIYRVHEDFVTADVALGKYGFDGEHIAHNYSGSQLQELKKTGEKDFSKAIKLQCYYTLREVDRLEKEYKDNNISYEELQKLLLDNYIFNRKIGNIKNTK